MEEETESTLDIVKEELPAKLIMAVATAVVTVGAKYAAEKALKKLDEYKEAKKQLALTAET